MVPFLVHGHAVIGGLRGDVIHEPVEVIPVVLDAKAEAVGLGGVDVALFIDGECGGRIESGGLVIGEDFYGCAIGDGEAGDDIGGDEAFFVELSVFFGGRELGVRVVGEKEVVGIDDAPSAAVSVFNADLGFLSLEVGSAPNYGAHEEVVLTRVLHLDFSIDEELDGGFSGVTSARDEKGEVGEVDGELGRGERADRGVALVGRADEVVVGVVFHTAIHAIRAGCSGGETEG